jgi:hypothetical protein
MDTVVAVLARFMEKGVRLSWENGQLQYAAPRGALSPEEIQILRTHKGQIAALLQRSSSAQAGEPKLERRPDIDRVPLTYSQLSHWHMHQVDGGAHIRQIASVTRLRGRVDLGALQVAIAEMIRRHEALRTQIVIDDGTPTQRVLERCDVNLDMVDLRKVPARSRELDLQRSIAEHILEPIDVTMDPLFGVRLISLDDCEQILIMSMEHLISDGISGNILLRDFLATYARYVTGQVMHLPSIPVQFPDYALWQARTWASWFSRHGEHWNDCQNRYPRLAFPTHTQRESTRPTFGWGAVPVRIPRRLKAALNEWCRTRRTTLAMSVFTAYAALVLRWCDVSNTLIRYQASGRTSPEVENTVGFFAAAIYVRVEHRDHETLEDLIRRVTEGYCDAQERIDFSYMESLVPRPAFTRNTTFNWVPQASKFDLPAAEQSYDTIIASPVSYEHPLMMHLEWDAEPVILLFDTDEEIVGHVYFPWKRFSMETMQRFTQNLQLFIQTLLTRPSTPVQDIVLE